MERSREARREDDDAVAVPGAAARILRAGERDREPAAEGHLLEFLVGKETELSSVRRPERPGCTLRSRQRSGLEPVQRAHEQDVTANLGPRDEGERSAVGRDSTGPASLLRNRKLAPSGALIDARTTRDSGAGRRAYAIARPNAASAKTRQRPQASASRRPARGAVFPGAASASGAAGSCSAMRASPMSRSRCSGSFSTHRTISERTRVGTAAGSADQSGSVSRIFAIESEAVSPANAACPVNIS